MATPVPGQIEKAPESPRPDALSTRQLLVALAFAGILGGICNFISQGRLSIAMALGASLPLLAVAGVLFAVVRGLFRHFRRPLAQPHAFAIFLVAIGLAGGCVIAGHIYNSRSPLSTPRHATIPRDVPPESIEELTGALYRNNKWSFRVRFPDGWEIKNGDGKHVVKKAELPNVGSISVTIREVPGQSGERPPIEELTNLMDLMIAPALERLNGKMIDKKGVKINNRAFAYSKMRVVYENLHGRHPAINELYLTGEYGHIFLITSSVREDKFPDYSRLLVNAANSFEIEDYDAQARRAGFPVEPDRPSR